jgi:hypothetical protein
VGEEFNTAVHSSQPVNLLSFDVTQVELKEFLLALVEFRKGTISFLSVRLSVRTEQLQSNWMNFQEI